MKKRVLRGVTHRQTLVTVVVLLALALTVSVAALATAASVSPEYFPDWQAGDAASECAQAGCSATYAYKVNGAAPNGTYTSSGNTITISNSNGTRSTGRPNIPFRA